MVQYLQGGRETGGGEGEGIARSQHRVWMDVVVGGVWLLLFDDLTRRCIVEDMAGTGGDRQG